MPLTMELRDRTGRVLGSVGESWASIDRMWPDLGFDEYPLLGGVDRDDDTMFNRLQLGPLTNELERLLTECRPRAREMISELTRLARRGIELPDAQLWFLGD